MGVVNSKRASDVVVGFVMKYAFGVELLWVLDTDQALPVVGLIVQLGGMFVFNTASLIAVIGAKKLPGLIVTVNGKVCCCPAAILIPVKLTTRFDALYDPPLTYVTLVGSVSVRV